MAFEEKKIPQTTRNKPNVKAYRSVLIALRQYFHSKFYNSNSVFKYLCFYKTCHLDLNLSSWNKGCSFDEGQPIAAQPASQPAVCSVSLCVTAQSLFSAVSLPLLRGLSTLLKGCLLPPCLVLSDYTHVKWDVKQTLCAPAGHDQPGVGVYRSSARLQQCGLFCWGSGEGGRGGVELHPQFPLPATG